MKCIDFDKHFQNYMMSWMQKNGEKYKNNMDKIEEMMPDIYMQYLGKPAAWLDGVAPGAYFEQFDDAKMLVEWLGEYTKKKVAVPDLLLERIVDLGKVSEPHLLALLGSAPEDLESMAISLLRELESTAPMAEYIRYIAALDEENEKGNLCAEALTSMGDAVVAPILAALDSATSAGRDVFADILSNFPGDDRIFDLLMERFVTCDDRRALFASYLAKLGDPRALGKLESAAKIPDLGYLDYLEIVNAIEALGGDRPQERTFDGDPIYESLKRV